MRLSKMVVTSVVALVLALPAPLLAQQSQIPMVFAPGELEQLAAPIALYPDPLLAHVLMAATYPLEVVQAARFIRLNPGLKDGPLNELLRAQDWDDSVKALAQVPQILEMMDDHLDWAQRLGEAFLAQRSDLMDAVQSLRVRAQAQGMLASSPEQIVRVEAPIIYIQPASPQVIYVPVYNPLVVYGPWPHPAYQPHYYRPIGWPVARGGFYSFGGGTVVGFGLWGACDWHRRIVFIDAPRYLRYTEVVNVPGRRREIERGMMASRVGDRMVWQHDVRRRESSGYGQTPARPQVATPRPILVPSREPVQVRVEQPSVGQRWVEQPRREQPRVVQARVELQRVEQPWARQPWPERPKTEPPGLEQPRPNPWRPQQGSAAQEAIRPGAQPTPRPESSRPNPGDSPRPLARVQASPAPAQHQRQDVSEGSHENRGTVSAPTPAVRSATVATATAGSAHEASRASALIGSVPGGVARR